VFCLGPSSWLRRFVGWGQTPSHTECPFKLSDVPFRPGEREVAGMYQAGLNGRLDGLHLEILGETTSLSVMHA
jgi:hypothetical protein